MEQLLDAVSRVTPTKNMGVTSTIGNTKNPEETQEIQIRNIQVEANTTEWQMKMKELIPSLNQSHLEEMEDIRILSIEDLGYHDKESLSSWKISTDATKRKLMVLIDCIVKHGYDANKSMNEIFRGLHVTNTSNNDTVETPKNPRKHKLKWSAKEVPLFYGGPKK